MKITGLTANTPENLLLDAGAFFLNYDPAKDTPATAQAKLIGATQGGGSFSAVPTVRQIEVDGAPANTKGLEIIDGWVTTMVANVKEVTINSLKIALGAAKVEGTISGGPEGYSKITGKNEIADADYSDNITWIGKLKGSGKPVMIVIRNALSINGLNLTVSDKNEAVIPITLTGHYKLDDLETPPYEIIYPNAK